LAIYVSAHSSLTGKIGGNRTNKELNCAGKCLLGVFRVLSSDLPLLLVIRLTLAVVVTGGWHSGCKSPCIIHFGREIVVKCVHTQICPKAQFIVY